MSYISLLESELELTLGLSDLAIGLANLDVSSENPTAGPSNEALSPNDFTDTQVPISSAQSDGPFLHPSFRSETRDKTMRQPEFFDSGSARWSTASGIKPPSTRNISTDNNQFPLMQESLRLVKDLTILILGENGEGKSNFINAFLSYILFDTLDQAVKANKPAWLAPCAVQPLVYPVVVEQSTIRLINTPSVGDNRSYSYDKKNMAEILSTIKNYNELHGIVILVDNEMARRTTVFRYCMKELLAHLSRHAVPNIVFGFTATRSSNYTPGMRFEPLSKILEEHPAAGLCLENETTYCFDSETLRYLAKLNSGLDTGHSDDIRQSWDHSRREAFRLMKHFSKQLPHHVTNTIGLNQCRLLLTEVLVKPLQSITRATKFNPQICEDKKAQISILRERSAALLRLLRVNKVQLRPVALEKPRMVCTNANCVDYRDDGSGEGRVVTVYKTICHDGCYLTNVRPDEIASPGFLKCEIFDNSGQCTQCNHPQQQHMHVLYNLEEKVVTVVDSEVEAHLAGCAEEIRLLETALKDFETLQNECHGERVEVERVMQRLAGLLEHNSIVLYNDATLQYLDEVLIPNASRTSRRLNARESRRNYETFVGMIQRNLDLAPAEQLRYTISEEKIQQQLEQLYKMKHFGAQIKQACAGVATMYVKQAREARPYKVQI